MEDSMIYRILVVDDEESYRSMIHQFLQKIGFSCSMAQDAVDALNSLEKDPFDLVISDIRMEGKDGLELMREALVKYPQLAFIIMTGHAGEYSYSDIIDAGATDFISKPFEMGQLKAKLERIEREKSTLRQLKLANEALAREAEISASFAELSKALISPLPIESISNLVLDCARQLTDSPTGFVGYIDWKTHRSICSALSRNPAKHSASTSEDREGTCGEFSGLVEWVFENPTALRINAVDEDPQLASILSDHSSIRRFLCAPAMAGGLLLGQVVLANAPNDYTEKDQMIAERLSVIFALAIHRKWADEELKQTEEELRKARDELEELVAERTTKLTKAGDLLKRSIDRFKEIAEE